MLLKFYSNFKRENFGGKLKKFDWGVWGGGGEGNWLRWKIWEI